jgi:hypothetical protein
MLIKSNINICTTAHRLAGLAIGLRAFAGDGLKSEIWRVADGKVDGAFLRRVKEEVAMPDPGVG